MAYGPLNRRVRATMLLTLALALPSTVARAHPSLSFMATCLSAMPRIT